MVTAVTLWALSVLVLSAVLALVIAAQAGSRSLRRLLHGRHGRLRVRSTRPGPRRGPGLVVHAPGQG